MVNISTERKKSLKNEIRASIFLQYCYIIKEGVKEESNMKKIVILMVLLCLLLVGCGEEEFSVEGLEPSDQVEAIINHYVEEKVFHGEVTDLQINPDADEGGKYVCLLYVDWDVENSSDNAKGVLQSYADELCYQLADNGNTSKFVVFFNAIRQGGLYKRGYDIKDGEPTVADEIIQF